MKAMIDLYLVSGFLGSGKTTFLKQLLEQCGDRKVGIIVNEFGSVGIDGKILQKEDVTMVEINNGSIFCACLKAGFVKTLIAFLEQPIEVLFIEASGMADPSSMKQLLKQLAALMERRPEITRQYEYRGSVCLIDAGHFLEFCEIFQPTINQVKKSSLLILNKIDEVSEECIQELHNKLNELNPGAFIYDTVFGKVPAVLLESKISPDGVLEEESCNTVWNRPATYVLQMNDKYELKIMKQFAMEMSEWVLRFKGFFLTPEGELAHADCVGDYIRIDRIEMDASKGKHCEIVLIGKSNMDFGENLLGKWNKFLPDKKINHEKC
jgi:G3E family GTPase